MSQKKVEEFKSKLRESVEDYLDILSTNVDHIPTTEVYEVVPPEELEDEHDREVAKRRDIERCLHEVSINKPSIATEDYIRVSDFESIAQWALEEGVIDLEWELEHSGILAADIDEAKQDSIWNLAAEFRYIAGRIADYEGKYSFNDNFYSEIFEERIKPRVRRESPSQRIMFPLMNLSIEDSFTLTPLDEFKSSDNVRMSSDITVSPITDGEISAIFQHIQSVRNIGHVPSELNSKVEFSIKGRRYSNIDEKYALLSPQPI
jgi:hypothetical protein